MTTSSATSSAPFSLIPIDDTAEHQFGRFKLRGQQVFALTQHSFAFVNLKPVQPGHVLVSPRRVVDRFVDLTIEELTEVFALTQFISKMLEKNLKNTGFTIAIQDGKSAGQTVAHCHVHLMPRNADDFGRDNDVVYEKLERNEIDAVIQLLSEQDASNIAKAEAAKAAPHPQSDAARKGREDSVLFAEAAQFRTWLKEM